MRLLVLLFAAMVAGCSGNSASRVHVAYYDFGDSPAPSTPPLSVAAVEVRAPSWLGGTAMQYRQTDADPARRQSYAESRWVAPPAELIEAALRRSLMSGDAPAVGCRLRIDLDEFIQAYDASGASHARFAARVTLLARGGDVIIAHHAFALERPAGSDARTGVAAFAAILREFPTALETWLRQEGSTPTACRA